METATLENGAISQEQSEWEEFFGQINKGATEALATRDKSISNEAPRRLAHRRDEPTRDTPLQARYQQQLRNSVNIRHQLAARMARIVAYTWMPGRDRKTCPSIVSVRDARLLTMDRYPGTSSNDYSIGLTMYKTTVDRAGRICYAGPDNIEMFKDFSLRPAYKAGGTALDSRNEDVFRAALELDLMIELTATGKINPADFFDPPTVLAAFPHDYAPRPEDKAAMHERVVAMLKQEASHLRCLLSPGGRINCVLDNRDGFRTIKIESGGKITAVRVPMWVTLADGIVDGAETKEGQPLGDLPRGNFVTAKEVAASYPLPSIEWLQKRIMDEQTETITLEEESWDQDTGAFKKQTNTWKCLPAKFVQTQSGRAARHFLDFRGQLGRYHHSIDTLGNDVWTKHDSQVKVDTLEFAARPMEEDMCFTDAPDLQDRSWYADLMSHHPSVPWFNRLGVRGIHDEEEE